jgi:hypothetical protein
MAETLKPVRKLRAIINAPLSADRYKKAEHVFTFWALCMGSSTWARTTDWLIQPSPHAT